MGEWAKSALEKTGARRLHEESMATERNDTQWTTCAQLPGWGEQQT
jgi:hypothetical protein